MDIKQFWRAILKQDRDNIRVFFHDNAYVNWHCTNERFTVNEFIQANCEYPGHWNGEIERVENVNDLMITVTHVFPKDKSMSFHVTSFISILDGKIISMDEYWSDDGDAPAWRQEMNIGTAIK